MVKLINLNKFKKTELPRKFKFSFNFISLISPYIINNIKFLQSIKNDKKVLIKQSYMLLTWFYYLTFLNSNAESKKKLKIFILPLRTRQFTLIKAPMAHKTNSKEQYLIRYFKFNVSFISEFEENKAMSSLNDCLLFMLLSSKYFPVFETNLFFLKSYRFNFFFSDNFFFNYYFFTIKTIR